MKSYCPFCRKDTHYSFDSYQWDDEEYYALCHICQAHGPIAKTPEEAEEKWITAGNRVKVVKETWKEFNAILKKFNPCQLHDEGRRFDKTVKAL